MKAFIAVAATLVVALNTQAQVPAHVGRHQASEADAQAILQVTTDFQAALAARDAKKLSGLLLHSKILFASPRSPTGVRKARAELDVHADGVPQAGAADFLNFVATARKPIEERFYNIKVTQDGHLAWVMFDFEFLEDGKVENHGIETWQMLKTADESWKILSVVWSSHGAPNRP